MKVAIFDMDGTLADCSWRLHHIEKDPKDYDTFYDLMHEDPCITNVLRIAHALQHDGIPIIVSTGRPVKYLNKIHDWLINHSVFPNEIFTRREDDHRHDYIVKKEHLQEMRGLGFDPLFVFDDRDSVVKMWREEGLTCFQCREGDF